MKRPTDATQIRDELVVMPHVLDEYFDLQMEFKLVQTNHVKSQNPIPDSAKFARGGEGNLEESSSLVCCDPSSHEPEHIFNSLGRFQCCIYIGVFFSLTNMSLSI
jgi:hypothetical protein